MAVQTVFKRYEIKYLITREQERAFLAAIGGRVVPDIYGEHTVCNIYFDTPDFDLIRTSIDKPVYKEKLRLRTYGSPQDQGYRAYVELKKKYNGEVFKRREEMTLAEAEDYLYRHIRPQRDSQIIREIDWFLQTRDVRPTLYLAYDRHAFLGAEDPELRLTIDHNIRGRRTGLKLTDGTAGEPILDDNMSLMEIKVVGAIPLWMTNALTSVGAKPTSFSKYGTYYMTHPEMYLSVAENHRSDCADKEAFSGGK